MHGAHASLFAKIAALPDKWFQDTVTTESISQIFPTRNSKRRVPRNDGRVADFFRRRLEQSIVDDLFEVFHLERCALLLPLRDKTDLWHLSAHRGMPKKIRKRNVYRPGLGLSGLTLAGEVIWTSDILRDERRSGAHGDQWVTRENKLLKKQPQKALLGVPVWSQSSDLYRETLGAIIAIRSKDFSADEQSALQIAAQLVSQGFQGINVYQEKLETAHRHAELASVWRAQLSWKEKLSRSLALITHLVPFERLLLSVVSSNRSEIVGEAVIGFRPGLIIDTRRKIHQSSPAQHSEEDILALFVRLGRREPQFVSREDPHVHRITALRHQVNNDLLLIPLVDSHDNYLGIILAELPNVYSKTTSKSPLLSPAELQRCSLFAQQLAEMIAIDRQAAAKSRKLETQHHVLTSLTEAAESLNDGPGTLTEILATVCQNSRISRATIYDFDDVDGVLTCGAAFGIDRELSESFRKTIFPKSNAADFLTRTLLSRVCTEGTLEDGFPFITESPETADLKSIAQPVRSEGDSLGILVVATQKSDDGIQTLHSIKQFFGVFSYALRLKRTERRLNQESLSSDAQESFVHLVSTIIADRVQGFSNLRQIVEEYEFCFQTILQEISTILGSQLCELFLPELPVPLDDDGQIPPPHLATPFNNITRYCSIPNDSPIRSVAARVPESSKKASAGGLTASVLQTMRRQYSPNVPQDPVWSQSTREFLHKDVRSWLGVPIIYDFDGDKYCWGVLSATRRRTSSYDRRVFSEDELVRAQTLADWIGVALARRYEMRAVTTRTESFLRRFDHDLPNLINHVQTLAEMFLSEKGKVRRQLGKELQDSLDGLQACFSSMLIAHGPPNASPMEPLQVNVERVFDQLKQLIQLQSSAGGTTLEFSNLLNNNQACLGDEERLVYTLLILIQNSLRSCREVRYQNKTPTNYSPRVLVSFSTIAAKQLCEVRIEDNGVGFHPAMGNPNRITEGNSFWKKGKKGMGIGRALVRKLVNSLGGTELKFTNKTSTQDAETLTTGAVVSFRLPSKADALPEGH